MHPTRHRRRFHTDRIVKVRRARYLRESPIWWPTFDQESPHHQRRMSYGYLASTDPWDCGHTMCGVCHWSQWDPRRARENRAWRKDWSAEIAE